MAPPQRTVQRYEQYVKALKYPAKFIITNDRVTFSSFSKLIVWLEGQVIRSYDESDREGLAESDEAKFWEALEGYLKELNYRPAFAPPKVERGQIIVNAAFAAVIEFLLQRGARFAYADVYQETNKKHTEYIKIAGTGYTGAAIAGTKAAAAAAPAAGAPPAAGVAKKKGAALGPMLRGLEDIRSMAATLCEVLKIPVEEDDDAKTLLAQAMRVIKQLGIIDEEAQKGGKKVSREEFLKHIPLNFETKDRKVDELAKLLTVLYTADLRDLQDTIDETLVEFQNLTGNPKTDIKLGKVGS